MGDHERAEAEFFFLFEDFFHCIVTSILPACMFVNHVCTGCPRRLSATPSLVPSQLPVLCIFGQPQCRNSKQGDKTLPHREPLPRQRREDRSSQELQPLAGRGPATGWLEQLWHIGRDTAVECQLYSECRHGILPKSCLDMVN